MKKEKRCKLLRKITALEKKIKQQQEVIADLQLRVDLIWKLP